MCIWSLMKYSKTCRDDRKSGSDSALPRFLRGGRGDKWFGRSDALAREWLYMWVKMLLHTKSLALTCVLLDGHLANHVAKTRLTLNNSWRIIEKQGKLKWERRLGEKQMARFGKSLTRKDGERAWPESICLSKKLDNKGWISLFSYPPASKNKSVLLLFWHFAEEKLKS